jgi:hypothetical protein
MGMASLLGALAKDVRSPALAGGAGIPDCGVELSARGAQQQKAQAQGEQRRSREAAGIEGKKRCLLHGSKANRFSRAAQGGAA